MSETSENESKKQSRPLSLSAEELKNLGQESARLMDSPVFNLAWSNTIQELQDQWLATEPKESQKRESLHAMTRTATLFLGMLNDQYQTALRIVEDDERGDNKLLFDYDENSGFPGHDERSQ